MGGAKSSGSVGAGAGGAAAGPVAPPARRPDEEDPELSRTWVQVLRDPVQYENYKRLEPLVNKLKTAISREGIPAYQMNASHMVSGYSDVGRSGVRVSLGREGEMASMKRQATTLERQGRQQGVRKTMFARYPDRIDVNVRQTQGRATARRDSPAAVAQKTEWLSKIRSAGESIGLRWHEPQEWGDPYFT